MKKTWLGMFLVLMLLVSAGAKASGQSQGHGYAYFAPGGAAAKGETGTWTAHVGGGGEGFFMRNVGLGADVGYLTPIRSWSDGIGTFSPSFIARFRANRDEDRLEPFVAGGYTLFFRQGTASGVNFGGGINYWFTDRGGVRFELRDSVMIPGGDVRATHFVGLRIGLTFR